MSFSFSKKHFVTLYLYHLKDLTSGEENCRATCTATNELICFLPNKQFISFVSNGVRGLWAKAQLEETFDIL